MAVRAKVVDHVTKSLTVAQRTDLGRPIDSAELGAALQSMKPNTAPGPDGWPVAFFLTAPSTFAAILPDRLSTVAPTIIHPTQAAFVRGCSMRDNIHLLTAQQHKATRDNVEWHAIFLDFAKAYDCVD
ncbi:hypothetical protein H310_14393 [Aphanomyces invadans]|uniref:Reverse transcriptase domain-containing protein n=1 Tax=Aphanomyces invadans TaxID=157072 RepID=A0A024TBF8_9STRA|nr:hypothetical protein H310_14393 [Aphanomyces invadans]ETV90906.1 hypothetical protein H310_14393 [Aphanomyces invadans]|eukprot:XP_008880471.1 hypothetical protein H310_14393 [Aphanomyces invadans]